MSQGLLVFTVALAIGFLTLIAPLGSSAISTPLLNTSLVPHDMAQTTEHGVEGVNITYTSTIGVTPLTVYISVANSVGQTVYFTFVSNSKAFVQGFPETCFFGLGYVGLHGNYTASVFATNDQGVVLTILSSLEIQL